MGSVIGSQTGPCRTRRLPSGCHQPASTADAMASSVSSRTSRVTGSCCTGTVAAVTMNGPCDGAKKNQRLSRVSPSKSLESLAVALVPPSPTGLYWNTRGHVRCEEHAREIERLRWDAEGWAPMQVASDPRDAIYQCQKCRPAARG